MESAALLGAKCKAWSFSLMHHYVVVAEPEGKKARGGSAPMHAVALLSRDGSRIFVGQARGILAAVDRHSLQFLDALKVAALLSNPGRAPLLQGGIFSAGATALERRHLVMSAL